MNEANSDQLTDFLIYVQNRYQVISYSVNISSKFMQASFGKGLRQHKAMYLPNTKFTWYYLMPLIHNTQLIPKFLVFLITIFYALVITDLKLNLGSSSILYEKNG